MAQIDAGAVAPAHDEHTLVQVTAWVLVLLALGMDLFHQSWRVLATAAGVVVVISVGLAARLKNVNLVAFLKKTGIWYALILLVLVVELGVHANWDLNAVTSREVITATVLVLVGDLVAEVRDLLSEAVSGHQRSDTIRQSVNTLTLMITRFRRMKQWYRIKLRRIRGS